MSLLRNIWRPNEGSGKGPGSPAESVLTERLAELLGREAEEEREPEAARAPEVEAAGDALVSEVSERGETSTVAGPDEPVSMEPVRSAPPAPPMRRPPMPVLSRPSVNSPGVMPPGTGAFSIARATEQALEKLKSAEQEFEAQLRKRAEEFEKTIEAAALSVSEHGAAAEKPLEEAAERFRSEAREWFDGARRELRDQLEVSRESLEADLKKNHLELVESAKRQIEAMAQASEESSAESSRLAAQQQIGGWLKEQTETSRRQTESGTLNLAKAGEQAVTRLQEMEQRIEATLRAQVEEYRRAVEAAAADLERKGISQAKFQSAALELQQATEQILEKSTKKIEERTEQAANSLAEAARAALEAALSEQRERWASTWQEQGRTAVESVSQAAEAGQRQLEGARKAAEEGLEDAAREHSRRLVESAAAELKSDSFRKELIAETTAEIELAARNSVARSADDLNRQKDAVAVGLSGTLKQASQKFIEEVGERLDAASRAWFETAGQKVQEEYRLRLAKWLEEQAQVSRRQTEAASQAVARMAEQAKSRLETIARETESTFRGRAEEQQRQWIETALEQARTSGLEQKVIDRGLAELEKNAARFLEQSAQRLAQQAENSKTEIAAEMEAAAKKMLEGAEASLETISWQHRGRLAQWWEERQQSARREAEAHHEGIARAGQKSAEQLKTAQAEIELELKSHAREHQQRLLDSTMQELRGSGAIERLVTEATGALRVSTNDVLSRSSEELREMVDASRQALENQAQASRRGMAEELARVTEQAQASVEGAGKAVTEDYRRQLSVWWEERTQSAKKDSEEAAAGISRSARQASDQLLAMRKEMENELRVGLEHYRKGLREAAAEEIRRQGFQKEALETIAAELDTTARELATRSTRELQQHINTALSGLDEKVKTTRQNFLDETQKKLGEMTKASMDTAGSRFHEFLVKNVKELEREQEDWLQRKRESVWLDINKASAPPAHSYNAPLQRTLLRDGESDEKEKSKATTASSVLSWVLGVFAVIAMAGALTAVILRVAPQKNISMQLRNQPPDGWVATNPTWTAKRRSREMQLAQAYWLIAVNDLQHQYGFNTELPSTPPAEFKVDTTDLKDDAATRTRYWDEMRTLWTSPDTWQQTVTVSNGPATRAIEWLRQKFFSTAEKTPQSAGP